MDSPTVEDLPVLGDASLLAIDWARLKVNDEDERKKLLEAGENQGFFYLDLSSDDGFLQDWNAVLDLMEQYFHLDVDQKMKDHRMSDTHGYEPVATSSGAVKGRPDYYESLKASKDELSSRSSSLAPVIAENHELISRFCGTAHEVVMTILSSFGSALFPDGNSNFELFHSENKESLTTLSLFRYPKQETADVGVGHGKHTDLGTLTFLLCHQWGLQVLARNPGGWRFVAPKKNHAIINVGDTLRFLSGNRLCSAVHRVVPTQELQHEDRYSIAYFLRAENGVVFKDSVGRMTTAKSWHDEKFEVFRAPHEEQEKAPILTGGMERGESLVPV
ncbi:2OG-Fe(II) oxygenase family oxidoreductase [Penicillium canariense]|uniref:2OG-Fe(II) oxygenase family oxidoreductase n=1 Tax=Penicillium canariense TaxID=189055 RepID=A0A9W9HP79_9EURO|nr:2OG-Fe(II) oxygenase family oxidoreductase [Penicillium canariense]KAJ5153191.1 2OG-Fe(II) oxygenase family oxidoreductase [Penicillium canariense]